MLNKKIRTIFAAAVAFTSFSVLHAQKVTLTNTFGGDTDKLSGKDLFVIGKDGTKEDLHLSDRLQLDVASEKLDSRIRFDVDASNSLSGKTPAFQLRGYLNLRPISWLNVIGGNKFFSKHALPGSYLGASDDFVGTGKLAGDNGAAVVFDNFGLKLAGGIGYESDINVNAGAGYTIDKIVSFGVTGHNITKGEAANYSAYAKLLSVDNFLLTLGYSYNFNGGYLPDSRHEAQFSTGYNFSDIGLGLYLDGLFALTSEYYNSTTGNYVNYKDKDGNNFAPFSLAFLAKYKVNDDVSLAGKINVAQKQSNGDKVLSTTVYPYVDYKTSVGTFRGGVRVNFDDKTGYTGLSVPISWVYSIGTSK